MEEMRNKYKVLVVKNVKGRDYLEDLSVDGMIMLE
jgi:hypothetical protein